MFLPTDLKAYSAVHTELLELFGRFTDLVEPVSIDEAVLDVAGSRRLFGPPRAIAGRIQELVYDEQGLTCTLGVAPNKLLAKLAANLNKPAGIGVLDDADVHGRLRALPVGELYGVGPVTQERLHALGLTTVGMLQDVPLPFLAAAFGRGARPLKQLAFGRSLSPVRSAAAAPSSLSHETTFATDTAEPLALRATLLALTDELMARLREQRYAARTVALKVRDNTFHTLERHTHPGAAHDEHPHRLRRRRRPARRRRSRSAARPPAGRHGERTRKRRLPAHLRRRLERPRRRRGGRRRACPLRPPRRAPGRHLRQRYGLVLDSTHLWARAPEAGARPSCRSRRDRPATRVPGACAVTSQRTYRLTMTHGGSTRRYASHGGAVGCHEAPTSARATADRRARLRCATRSAR